MKYYLGLIVLLFVFKVAWAEETYQVVWVAEYSNHNLKAPDHSLGQKLVNWVFGKEDYRMQRPFTLTLLDSSHCLFLDQGAGLLGLINLKTKRLSWLNHKNNYLLYSAVGICVIGKDSVLIADGGLNKIFLYQLSKRKLSVWNPALQLNHPTGLAWDAVHQQLIVVETGKHRLLFLNKKGEIVRTFGKRGTQKGEFNYPTFVWVDKFGTIYVNDSMNFRIQILTFDGTVKQVFGQAGDVSGYLARPKGIATDSKGNIYVADALSNVIQVFDHQGHLLTYFGGQGKKQGQFWMPVDIYIDSNDRIFVADSFNSRIQEFKLKKQGQP